jgi:predicted HicB family RNase H-like nuclease
VIIKEETFEVNTSTINYPKFGILSVDIFDDQQEPIMPSQREYSFQFLFRLKRTFDQCANLFDYIYFNESSVCLSF